MIMTNWEKAQLIVAALNEKGAGLENGAWPIVAKALEATDPYIPTDEEWAANPWAQYAATDIDGGHGRLCLYDKIPRLGKNSKAWFFQRGMTYMCVLRIVERPRSAANTIRCRPDNIPANSAGLESN